MTMKQTIQETLPVVTDAIKGGISEMVLYACLVNDGMKPKNAEKVIQWAKQRALADAEAIVVFISDTDIIFTDDEPNLPRGA